MKIYSSRKHQILLLTLFSYVNIQILEIFIVKKDKSLNYNLFQFEIALYTLGPGRFHFQRSIKRDVVPFSRTSERKVQRKQSKITRRFHPVGPVKSQLKIITAILVVKLMRDPAANKFDECHLSTQLTAKLDRAGPPWIIPCSVKKKKKRREERERERHRTFDMKRWLRSLLFFFLLLFSFIYSCPMERIQKPCSHLSQNFACGELKWQFVLKWITIFRGKG